MLTDQELHREIKSLFPEARSVVVESRCSDGEHVYWGSSVYGGRPGIAPIAQELLCISQRSLLERLKLKRCTIPYVINDPEEVLP